MSAMPLRSGNHVLTCLPRVVPWRSTRKRRGLLMVVSILSTLPCLSYILIEFSSTRCFTLMPSGRRCRSLLTSPAKRLSVRRCKSALLLRCQTGTWHDAAARDRVPPTCGARKHDIGGRLCLAHAPVVASDSQTRLRMDPGINSLRERVDQASPIAVRQLIHQLLGPCQIRDTSKAVISLAVADAHSIHLPGQPFASVETDLNGERQPRLQTDMQQAKLPIEIVKVQVQTLTFFGAQLQSLRRLITFQIKRLTGFDTSKHRYQTLLDAVPRYNLQRYLFFRFLRRGEILIRTTQFAGALLRLFDDPFRQAFNVGGKIFEQDMLAVQENLQPTNMGNRSQRAPKQHPIKARKSSSYAVTVPLQETLHDLPPAFCLLVQTDNARVTVMKRSSLVAA